MCLTLCCLCPQYRTLVNYRSPEFLGPRIGDKVIFSLLVRVRRPRAG